MGNQKNAIKDGKGKAVLPAYTHSHVSSPVPFYSEPLIHNKKCDLYDILCKINSILLLYPNPSFLNNNFPNFPKKERYL